MSDDRRPAHQQTTDKAVGGNPPETYGEPNGPRPPHFDVEPKAKIDAERSKTDERRRPAGKERDRGGFHSGMTSPEATETVGGPRRNNR